MLMFSTNIQLLRKRRGRSQEDVAAHLEIKRSSLSGYENGTSEPPLKNLIKISDYYKVSIDYLVKYDLKKLGEMELSELEKGHEIDLGGKNLRVLATTVDAENEENIELIPEKAKAGYSAGYSDPEYLAVLPTFQLPFLSRNKKYRSFQITGDSMPPVNPGAYVTGEYLQNWNMIRDGHPYIVVTKEDGIVFKMVYNKIESDECLQLVSTNPKYAPYNIGVSEILEIWKFVNYINDSL